MVYYQPLGQSNSISKRVQDQLNTIKVPCGAGNASGGVFAPLARGPWAAWSISMGACQNYGPFLGPYYNTAPII